MPGGFWKLDYDAWDEDTVALTLEEEGAYLRVCNHIYRRHGPIPNSEALLCQLWRCHTNRARSLLRRLIDAGKLFVTDDNRIDRRAAT